MDKTYLVTGATGFLGNVVVKKLLERGERVVGFARSEAKAQEVFAGMDLTMKYGDVRNESELRALFEGEGPFVVIHTAAIVSIGERSLDREMADVNINGTKNVLKLCKEAPVERLVHVSSVHAIPELPKDQVQTEVREFDPAKVNGKYAETKAAASALVMQAVAEGLNAVVVHPSGMIGPYDYSGTHLSQAIVDFAKGKIPASVKGGYNEVDVRDVADGVLAAANRGKTGECYLLTGDYYSVNKILGETAKLVGRKTPAALPIWLARSALPFLWTWSKICGKRPLYTGYSLSTLKSNGSFSCEKAARDLGYRPRPIEETIRDAVEFFRARGEICV